MANKHSWVLEGESTAGRDRKRAMLLTLPLLMLGLFQKTLSITAGSPRPHLLLLICSSSAVTKLAASSKQSICWLSVPFIKSKHPHQCLRYGKCVVKFLLCCVILLLPLCFESHERGVCSVKNGKIFFMQHHPNNVVVSGSIKLYQCYVSFPNTLKHRQKTGVYVLICFNCQPWDYHTSATFSRQQSCQIV